MMIIVPPDITEEQWRQAPIWLRWTLVVLYSALALSGLGAAVFGLCVVLGLA